MGLHFFTSYKNAKIKAIKISQNVTAILSKLNEIFCFFECTPNSNCSANHKDNENDQDNENLPNNKNEGN